SFGLSAKPEQNSTERPDFNFVITGPCKYESVVVDLPRCCKSCGCPCRGPGTSLANSRSKLSFSVGGPQRGYRVLRAQWISYFNGYGHARIHAVQIRLWPY